MSSLKYRKLPRGGKYKYEVTENRTVYLGEDFLYTEYTGEYFSVDSGFLALFTGYQWDGASGPAIDTDTWMLPSAVHDALLQLIELGVLSEGDRHSANEVMHFLCLRENMHPFRAWYSYHAVDKLYWLYKLTKRVKHGVLKRIR